MNLLAIDCACSILSVSVSRADDFFYMETEAGIKHSELVMDCIDGQMKKASLKPCELDGVLCMAGPGSFTGLRIGYSIAKALSLSLSIPFAPVPTLDCIALSADMVSPRGGLLIPVIEAGKKSFFFTVYRGADRLTHDMDAPAGEIAAIINEKKERDEKITLTGPAARALFNSLPENILNCEIFPLCEKHGYAKELICIAQNKNIFADDNSAFLFSGPLYIKKTDAELSLITRHDSSPAL